MAAGTPIMAAKDLGGGGRRVSPTPQVLRRPAFVPAKPSPAQDDRRALVHCERFAQKLRIASASLSYTSNTVMSCVTCSSSFSFSGRCRSLSLPPRFVTVVYEPTSSPMPDESIVVTPERSRRMLFLP